MKQTKYYTITQAARQLGITREAVFGAIRAGKLKASLGEVVAKAWKIDPKSVDAYMVSISHKERGKKSLDSLIYIKLISPLEHILLLCGIQSQKYQPPAVALFSIRPGGKQGRSMNRGNTHDETQISILPKKYLFN